MSSYQSLSLIHDNDVTAKPFVQLQQLYEHEFAPITGFKTNNNGLYDQTEIIRHWSKNFDLYLLYKAQRPIGFTVVNLTSMIDGDNNTRDIAEFFVLPDARKNDVGKWMAHEIFKKYPGDWEVRQLPELPAKYFWLKVISEFTQGNFTDSIMSNAVWKGSVQRFKA